VNALGAGAHHLSRTTHTTLCGRSNFISQLH
jgi:hypothetical protein